MKIDDCGVCVCLCYLHLSITITSRVANYVPKCEKPSDCFRCCLGNVLEIFLKRKGSSYLFFKPTVGNAKNQTVFDHSWTISFSFSFSRLRYRFRYSHIICTFGQHIAYWRKNLFWKSLKIISYYGQTPTHPPPKNQFYLLKNGCNDNMSQKYVGSSTIFHNPFPNIILFIIFFSNF